MNCRKQDIDPAAASQFFWNGRAMLGPEAGTQDRWAKHLEIETLKGLVRGPWIVDAGCGDGETLTVLATHLAATVAVGVDFARDLLTRARERAPHLTWLQGNLLEPAHQWGLPSDGRLFDTVVTERSLVNLPDWSAQEEAIWRLAALVAPRGQLILLENCVEGLAVLNEYRSMVGLPLMAVPTHNRYMEAARMRALQLLGFKAAREIRFCDWYYLISRVFHAFAAHDEGHEPAYDHPLNCVAVKLSSTLPECPVACGPGRIWIFERTP